ncbi:alpha-ketoglutarate-dependent dioxygenase AlkB family protein [Aeromonas simiae]|uniref:alpha-ketoglutarate-dependent dioxygenase AlkB family protein n=1 Tax=Aeromonas simiae TaxID=218936 RepID=UPI00266CD5D2|nr:alpha-ketoglutarate-dependent dioxygenase AlkB [Aeromonas simiae]MDO2947142.1 alpha-ketoglutarate-dependent dioxygenase AlkB [Aeromonas simiae]MDO2950754.1 alpha-ketoglutarate-dependent dioxygenase AlkB [Aeromonas simiae]MDO2954264.1 alpha-ketoglutarate-dependent dioxygenase AlkB [Aeromonas simiae]
MGSNTVQWQDLGEGALTLWPDWLTAAECQRLWAGLQALPWRQYSLRLFGREVRQPRLTAWASDADYRYSGLILPATPWPDELARLRDRVQATTGQRFNSVLLNYYRDGQDCIGWHSDDEVSLGPQPAIASLSLGATRRFLLRRRTDHGERHELRLNAGDLLLMGPGIQEAWQHALPRQRQLTQERINLTFRLLHPDRYNVATIAPIEESS